MKLSNLKIFEFAKHTKSDVDEYLDAQDKHIQGTKLKRTLKWPELVLIGIGCTIGAGIFVLTGQTARDITGPALFISFIFSGLCCLLSAFSYAEFAGLSPSAGSAYGYTRATMGEYAGWVIGWDLILEYAVTAASVAQGWSRYMQKLIKLCGGIFPIMVSKAPWAFDPTTGIAASTGTAFDLLAVLIILSMTLIIVSGVKESSIFNGTIVTLKIIIILFVIITGAIYVKNDNFSPFMPYGFAGISLFGYTAVGQHDGAGNPLGVLAGASIVFFAYVGFDAVTTNAEECENPKRDLPIGIIGSLVISTILYIAVSIVLVGMVPYSQIDPNAPLSSAFGEVGLIWAEFIVAIGALLGLTSVLMVCLMSQPRILMAMGRDGLLPYNFFTAIHSTFKTPYKVSLLIGTFVTLISAFIPLKILVELVSMGTLMAFGFVNISVIILRRYRPDLPRSFECPFVPYIPALGALFCLALMIALPSGNWIRLAVWFGIGSIIYFGYGRHNSMKMREQLLLTSRVDHDKLIGSDDKMMSSVIVDGDIETIPSSESQTMAMKSNNNSTTTTTHPHAHAPHYENDMYTDDM